MPLTFWLLLLAAAWPAAGPAAPIETLKAVAALPAHIAGAFQDLTACRQAPSGQYYIFDRRSHAVFTVAPDLGEARKLIEIGAEPGRVIDPSAFDLGPDDTFVVADAPRGRPRVQVFTTSGSSLSAFYLQGRSVPRIAIRNYVVSGIGSLEYTGKAVLLNQPERDALITEYTAGGTPTRSFGELRKTGHEADREVHLALNSGLVVANPAGGLYFVFLAGLPQFRKYDHSGALVFERHIEGVELDALIQSLPTSWKRRQTEDGELPFVLPSVYAAAADQDGSLWISLAPGVTYVYDRDGEKRRTVQFRSAGLIAPTGLSFTGRNRVLVTPGCYTFATRPQ